MIKRLFAHNTKRCRLDWARIHAVGEPGYWYISAAIRSSKAGKGGAHWTIRNGPPVAHGHLAHAISHGCG
jgi:hypothetical protein